MYSNNKASSSFDNNTITVTPIKVEMDLSPSYPTPNSSGTSVAAAATTSTRRPSTVGNSGQIPSSSAPAPSYTISAPTISAPTREKLPKAPRPPVPRKPPPTIDTFWPSIMAEVRSIQQVDAKQQALPLARIKKIMKLDENAKMIAAEAPLLFAKACEYFIQELTMRAWIHTEESRRRTLQRSDIAQAIANYDQFDFLIDIVPREDIKPSSSSHKKESQSSTTTTTTTSASVGVTGVSGATAVMTSANNEVLNFGTLTAEALATNVQQQQQHQQQQQAAPIQQQLQIIQQPTGHQQQMQYFIATPEALANAQNQQANAAQQQLQIIQQPAQPQYFITTHQQPQQLILTAGPNGQLTATPAPATSAQQQTTLLQNFAQHQQQQQQQQQPIQLLQQVMTPTGELTNVPIAINPNQLNLLRLQMQPAAQQLLQLSASGGNPTTATAHTVQTVQQQQQQHQQQHSANIFLNTAQLSQQQTQSTNLSSGNHSIVSTDRNLGSTFRPNC